MKVMFLLQHFWCLNKDNDFQVFKSCFLFVYRFRDEITRFCVIYAILGVAVMGVAYVSHSLWNTTASRQMFTIRKRFFAAILRQEIGWFDTHESGELNTRLSE